MKTSQPSATSLIVTLTILQRLHSRRRRRCQWCLTTLSRRRSKARHKHSLMTRFVKLRLTSTSFTCHGSQTSAYSSGTANCSRQVIVAQKMLFNASKMCLNPYQHYTFDLLDLFHLIPCPFFTHRDDVMQLRRLLFHDPRTSSIDRATLCRVRRLALFFRQRLHRYRLPTEVLICLRNAINKLVHRSAL